MSWRWTEWVSVWNWLVNIPEKQMWVTELITERSWSGKTTSHTKAGLPLRRAKQAQNWQIISARLLCPGCNSAHDGMLRGSKKEDILPPKCLREPGCWVCIGRAFSLLKEESFYQSRQQNKMTRQSLQKWVSPQTTQRSGQKCLLSFPPQTTSKKRLTNPPYSQLLSRTGEKGNKHFFSTYKYLIPCRMENVECTTNFI